MPAISAYGAHPLRTEQMTSETDVLESPRIGIVGCGPGSLEYLTPAAWCIIRDAEVLIGTRRLLDLFPGSRAERIEFSNRIDEILTEITRRPHKKIAVLVTGDPGLCSLAKPVLRRFGLRHCRVIPGISSIQVAFARIGLDWLDTWIIDAHGKDPEIDPAGLCRWGKIAVLGGRKGSLLRLTSEIKRLQEDFLIFVCENLTLPNERIMNIEPKDIEGIETDPKAVFLIVRKELLS